MKTQAIKEAEEQEEWLGVCQKHHQRQQHSSSSNAGHRPDKTVYMDGVFDLFHVGHLEAINQCAKLGNRVILGVTGDEDATGYKRRPIVPQDKRVAIVSALRKVDRVGCPCPLVVTKDFMEAHGIDLVVHGFANDADAERQKEFFEIPIALGKFQRIGYYRGLSITDRIRTIQEQQQDSQQQQPQQQAGQERNEVKDDEEKKPTTQSDSDEEKEEDNSVSVTMLSESIGEPQTSSGNEYSGAVTSGSKPR